jgi:UDP-N-acetylmuramoyl-tripeptide--D-alanyl-D-alanine ligase
MITLHDILLALTGIQTAQTGPMLTEAVIDSRVAIPGALFIALPGENSDGHRFVGAAFEKGAQVALVQQDMPDDMRVLDLRKSAALEEISIPEMPFCLRVDDSLQALQDLARYWRRKLSLRLVGITGSVGK